MPIDLPPEPPAEPQPTPPTPANTPLPGGGSWHWDATQLCWAANPPYTPTQPEILE